MIPKSRVLSFTVLAALALLAISIRWPTQIWWTSLTAASWIVGFISNCADAYTRPSLGITGRSALDLAAATLLALAIAIPTLLIIGLKAMVLAGIIGLAIGYEHFQSLWAALGTGAVSGLAGVVFSVMSGDLVPNSWIIQLRHRREIKNRRICV